MGISAPVFRVAVLLERLYCELNGLANERWDVTVASLRRLLHRREWLGSVGRPVANLLGGSSHSCGICIAWWGV